MRFVSAPVTPSAVGPATGKTAVGEKSALEVRVRGTGRSRAGTIARRDVQAADCCCRCLCFLIGILGRGEIGEESGRVAPLIPCLNLVQESENGRSENDPDSGARTTRAGPYSAARISFAASAGLVATESITMSYSSGPPPRAVIRSFH
jgi:hypothetical protein